MVDVSGLMVSGRGFRVYIATTSDAGGVYRRDRRREHQRHDVCDGPGQTLPYPTLPYPALPYPTLL